MRCHGGVTMCHAVSATTSRFMRCGVRVWLSRRVTRCRAVSDTASRFMRCGVRVWLSRRVTRCRAVSDTTNRFDEPLHEVSRVYHAASEVGGGSQAACHEEDEASLGTQSARDRRGDVGREVDANRSHLQQDRRSLSRSRTDEAPPPGAPPRRCRSRRRHQFALRWALRQPGVDTVGLGGSPRAAGGETKRGRARAAVTASARRHDLVGSVRER